MVAQIVKNCLQCGRPGLDTLVGKVYPLQSSCLEYSMDSGAWWATVCGISKSQTHLSDFHFNLSFPGGSAGKESACKEGDLGSIPGLGRPPWR